MTDEFVTGFMAGLFVYWMFIAPERFKDCGARLD